MALLTVRSVTTAGTTPAPAQCASGDTISASDIGSRGVILQVRNTTGGAITVAVSDPGTTPAGNAGTAAAVTVAATTGAKDIYVGPANVTPATQVATLTYTGTLAAGTTHEAVRY